MQDILLATVLQLALGAPATLNCPDFAPNDFYRLPVSSAPIDPNSTAYIRSAISAGNASGFWAGAEPVEFINVAEPQTPTYVVRQRVPYHSFSVRYPWRSDFRIEPLEDHHAIVVDARTCELFESYGTTFTGTALWAYSGAHWSLFRRFVPLDPGMPSAMASGLSLYAGMVRWEDVASGRIDHALNWAAPAHTVSQWSFVRPASDTDRIPFNGQEATSLPYGARLRLRASFDTSQFGPQSAAIAQAMKTYGIVLADTAGINELYTSMPLGGPNRWNRNDLAALRSIHIADFEVVQLGTIMQVPHH